MKEVIINGRYLSQSITGVQRYAHEVVAALDELIKTNEIDSEKYSVVLAVPPGVEKLPELEFIRIETVGILKDNLWEQISLPFFTRGKTLFNPCNSGPILGDKKQIITIHDASVYAVPDTYTTTFRFKFHIIASWMGKNATKVITDSEFSKAELIRFGIGNESRIQVIPLGGEHISIGTTQHINSDWKNSFMTPYVLFVGSKSKHKNIDAVISAMEFLEDKGIELIIAGGAHSKVFSKASAEEKQWYRDLGYVSDGQLRHLYENALCIVIPSFYEGFGLPPLEAMSCGCPVLASNRASLPEICGDAALYFDPSNAEEIADKIAFLLGNPSEREQLIQKGYAQVKKYNWKNTAKKLWKVIQKI